MALASLGSLATASRNHSSNSANGSVSLSSAGGSAVVTWRTYSSSLGDGGMKVLSVTAGI